VIRVIKHANAQLKGASANRENGFPEFEQPDIALSSAANLHTTSAGSTHIASECHAVLTAAGHCSIAAGKSLFASVRERMAFYALKAVSIISPGPVDLQSRNGAMTQSAQDDLSITSTNGIVRIAGKNGVDILCGGTLLRLRPEGLTGYTGGNFLVHAASHGTNDPQAMPVDDPVTPDRPGKFAAHHVLVEEGGGFAVANQPFRQVLDGQVTTGVTNALGEFPLATSNATAFGVIELLSQSAPGDVIGVVQTAVFEDAGKAATSSSLPSMPKRQAKIGGAEVRTPDTESTSQGKKPTYITCDPLNFGLRSYRFLNGTKQEDVSPASDRRMNIEYPVAKAYTESIRANLKTIDWGDLARRSTDEMGRVVVSVVSNSIYAALAAGVFGMPRIENSKFPLPSIAFVDSDEYGEYGMKSNYAACFNSFKWVIAINKLEVKMVAKTDRPDERKGPLCNLANTIYHEARHCQQKFWMISLWSTFGDSYEIFKNLETYYRGTVDKKVYSIAANTKFPDDKLTRIGVHRMLVFEYYWAMRNMPESEVEFKKDLSVAEEQVCAILNVSPEVARKRANMEIGYKSQLHEEDAYTCGDIVDRYWNHEDYFPNPGACRTEYQETIKVVGGDGDG
jgi:type VI secretion system secreted protein VgrG